MKRLVRLNWGLLMFMTLFLNACGSKSKRTSSDNESPQDPNVFFNVVFSQDEKALEDFKKGIRIYTITKNGVSKDPVFDKFYAKYMLVNHGITIEYNPSDDPAIIKYYSTMNAEITKEHEEGFFSFAEERARFLYETSSPLVEEDSNYITKH